MLLSGMLMIACVAGAQLPGPSTKQIAERELRARGARFQKVGLSVTFMPEHRDTTDDQYKKLCATHAKNAYVEISVEWKGKDEDLKYLRDLPNLKEIVWGGRQFHEGWCKEIESCTQLEGLFFSSWKLGDKGLAVVEKLPNLVALSLINTEITDDGLRHLKNLKRLRWLSLSGCKKVTDKGLAHLKNLTSLEDLNLEVTKTTAEGMVHLKNLKKLRRVRLSSYSNFLEIEKPQLPAKKKIVGLKHFAKMTELRMLDARSYGASDDDLKYLSKMTRLEELNLCYTRVSDKGLEHLARLTALKELDLFGTNVKGDGLRHLKGLKNLKSLVLGFCPLKDSAVEHLQNMTHLKYLEVGDSGMSKKAIEKLKRALPKTTVR
ncbi:MAG: hypothetical protein HYX68_00195 [Planctomycetes bacterium]|nr:hypothetical protein [Planctomycetota bacterium]